MSILVQNEIISRVNELRTASERLWEAACEDDRDFRAAADKCDDAYADAMQALEEGDANRAISALERAKSYECDGGDDQHATAAIALVSASTLHPEET